MVSEQFPIEVMGQPTAGQRVELIEKRVSDLEAALKEMVSQTVDKAVEAIRHSLTEVLLESQGVAAQKLGAEFDVLSERLEGRVNRSREFHESLINTMRNDQLKFQKEIKSTLTGLQTFQVPLPDVVDGSVNHFGAPNSALLRGDDFGKGFGGSQIPGDYCGGSGSGGGPGGSLNWKYRKIDMPIFDGSEPDGWLAKIERYFQIYRLTEEAMLEASAVAMEGDALRWFQWESKRRPIRRWHELKLAILRHFRSSHGGSLYEQWLSTTQTTTVDEYRRKFIETVAPLDRVSEEILLGHFVNGLKDEIKAEVRLLNPVNLEQAMELAGRIEDKLGVIGYRKGAPSSIKTGAYSVYSRGSSAVMPYSYNNPTSPSISRSWGARSPESQGSVQSPKTTISSNHSVGEIRRLTEKELQDKRAKGLCYRCDAKWVIGHRCKKELSVMLIEEEEGEFEIEDSDIPVAATEELITEVSLNSVIGLSNPKTMKLRGLIGSHEVVVMVDPGATHNFIALSTVEAAGVPVMGTMGFGVSLGNGEALKGEGVCKDVRVQLDGGVEVVEDFLPLKLGNSDVILGIQWLEKLGVVLTNWKTQIMTFELKGETVTLVGDPTLVRSQISLKAMIKVLQKEKQGYWVECNKLEANSASSREPSVPTFLGGVIEQYAKVFEEPKGLPPSRNREHAIVLKEGSNPVGVRPYRYPQCQKDEIERLIHEMLEAGIIKPSTSPYSSPVLLVKKKRRIVALLR